VSKDTDTNELRRRLQRQYPSAQIEIEGGKPLIKEIRGAKGGFCVFSGFLDSVLDRYGNCAILIGMIYIVSVKNENTLTIIAVATAALFGSIMVSYSRARAESDLNVIFKNGFSGYAANNARLFIIMIGRILNQIFASLCFFGLY
jgi:hypothetical protein